MKLLEEVRSINDMMDQKRVQEIREKVLWLNTNDEKNKEVLEEARRKGII